MMETTPEKIRVSVVLPTYNESENIGPLAEAIFKALGSGSEIIVVDDDSPDGTWKIIEDTAKTRQNLRLIRRIGKKGLTSALQEGIDAARGDIVCWMDCDFSMPPELYPELVACIDQGFDIAVGSRFVKGGGVEIITGSNDSVWAFILSSFLNKFVRRMLGPSFKDYTSGFIAVKKKVLDKIPLKGDYGEYFIDLIYRAIKKGYTFKEIPYLNKARSRGVSKTGTHLVQYLRRGLKYIRLTLGLKFSKIK
jgi:dolichol-phosphate mannosyltransferase